MQEDHLMEEDLLVESKRDTFLISLLSKRKEAISGRAGSGIEDDWTEDEEHYQGIDAANRAYVQSTTVAGAKRWATGYGTDEEKSSQRSVIFLNITAPYVDAASARVADMLLPTDDRAWLLKPTPIPRLPAYMLEQMGGVEAAQEAIEESQELSKQAAEQMQAEIDDCVTESNWHGEVRQVIEDASRIGSGVIKGPYPVKRTARMYQKMDSGSSMLVQVEEIKPGSKRIDAWNLFPDPSCGESIHNGSYIWEREYVSGKQLRDMMSMPGYDKQAIQAILKEGPSVSQSMQMGALKPSEQYELWIFYGTCDADDLEAVGVSVEDETPKASAMAVIVNDKMIKCALNVLDTGDFPYDVLAWQRRPGMPWGTGISRKVRTAQRMLNGSARIMMDNAGLSASPQIVIGNGITPADGRFSINGGKLWRAETDVVDVRGAFSAFVPPSVQAEMMNIINFALRMAEDTTGMPAMLQGIRGDAPETLGGMQMQNNNSTGVLRRLAKRFDDYVTEPHIRRYYDWMMQHSEREDIKGDFQIDVRASSALVERDAQQQFLMTLLQAADNPKYELDPAKLAAELLKGQRYDPKRIQYSPEKLQQLQSSAQPVTELDAAKIKLTEAQTRKTDAEAVTKNVEGLYSATQAAANIAIQPGVAQAADAIARSSGFVDQDASPIIPQIPHGTAAVPPPENTSPMFPPNPQLPPDPNEGMNQGIEGGYA